MQNSCDAAVGFEPDAEVKEDNLPNDDDDDESPGYNNDNVESVTDGAELESNCRPRCGSGCLKSLIVLVNLTFMAVGMVLIGLIVWIHVYRESFIYYRLIEDAASSLHPPPHQLSQHQHQQSQQHQQQYIPPSLIHRTTVIVVIALVVVIIAIGFLGCCGASVESICFLCLCVVLIVSIVIAEIVIASLVPSFKENMYNNLLGRMKYQVRTEYNRTTTTTTVTTEEEAEDKLNVRQLTLAWDTLQTRFYCCGVSGPRDYRDSTWYNQTKDYEGLYVPTTCCVLEDSEKPVARHLYLCQVEALIIDNTEMPLKELHVTGCHEAFVSYVESLVHHPLIAILFSITIILQLIDLILCCILILWIIMKLREIDASLNDDSEQDDEED